MRRTAWALMGALCLLAAASLAAQDRPRVSPPPLRTEARTLQPSPAHVWISGYWKWGGVNYEWIEGRWVKGKKGKIWFPGTWEQTGAHWTWKAGRWIDPEKTDPATGEPWPKKEKSKKDKDPENGKKAG